MISTTHVPDEPQKPKPCGYEWRTQARIYGLPLMHVAWGRDPAGKKLVARGFLAVGQYAFGVVSISQFGVGVICISQFGIGLCAVAQFSIAIASISQFAIAVITMAQAGVAFAGIGQHLLTLSRLLR